MDLEADNPFTRTAQASLIVFVDLHDKAHSKCANNNQGKTGYYIENYSRRIILKIRPTYPSFSLGGCHTGFDILSQFLKHFLTSLFECLSAVCQLVSACYNKERGLLHSENWSLSTL